jgi:hypothetical protein
MGLGMMALIASAVSAQAPPAGSRDDLDVTMRVIVDPNAKVPDEIVHKIPLPKPGQPAGAPPPKGKPDDPGAKGKSNSAEARDQGREFGQQTADQARQRSEEARRNKPDKPDKPPGKPPEPPGRPPDKSPKPGS